MGGNSSSPHYQVTPTVILNPSLNSTMMKEEIFGPVLPIITFSGDIKEAIAIIKARAKPLVLYYFGDDRSGNYKRLESETSSGAIVTNENNF